MPFVALVGGDEFRPETAEVDNYLLGRLNRTPARVAVLPTAAARENPQLAAQNGVRHFQELDAEAIAVMVVDKPSANDAQILAQLDGVDLVYLAGGDPRYLLDTLKDSLLWQRLSAAVQEECALAGSSAGAMVLGEMMGYQGEWSEALGLLPGICALPHFEKWGTEALPLLERTSLARGLTLLGIDGATGCVGWARKWQVVGPGAVTVIREGRSSVFHRGEQIQLA
jgi:cyanophycinase-like exopeptidase